MENSLFYFKQLVTGVFIIIKNKFQAFGKSSNNNILSIILAVMLLINSSQWDNNFEKRNKRMCGIFHFIFYFSKRNKR